jgi:signal-transduction protein with cAMP-binding, CBS, and nucleotidyltransferase domain
MSRIQMSAQPNTPIEVAVQRMINNKIRRLPVMESGKVVGIITVTGMAKAQVLSACLSKIHYQKLVMNLFYHRYTKGSDKLYDLCSHWTVDDIKMRTKNMTDIGGKIFSKI